MPKLLIGDVRGPQGETGVGIKEIVLKEGNSTGNTYTIELTNGQTFDIIAPAGPQGIQGIKGEQGTTDYNLLENVPENFTPKPHEHDERYPKIKELEKISTILQSNTGIKFDPDLLYLNYKGTKKVGYCYLDELADGIYECIKETTTTVNDSACFKNISNKNNSDRLDNLIKIIKKSRFSTYIEYISGLKIYYGRTAISGTNNVNAYYTINYPSEFSEIINIEASVFRDTELSTQQFPITVLFGLTAGGFCFRDTKRQPGAGYIIYYTLIGY